MNKLILMVGLPRSGKTTEARKLGFPIVCGDAIRLSLHGERFLTDAEPMVHTMARYMVKALFYAGHDTVIIDETNITVARRKAWESTMWETEYNYISTSKEECIRRATELNDPVIIPVIERMAEEFEGNGLAAVDRGDDDE